MLLTYMLALFLGQVSPTPTSYTIGVSDVLSIVFWRDKDMSTDVTVRPDGHISVPLLNDIPVNGLTPDQLRTELIGRAKKFLADPEVYVIVKEIHSRSVFITGNVAKPGAYPLNNGLTVLQLIAVSGGVLEYADAKHITIIGPDGSRRSFNYKANLSSTKTSDNIALQPGDTVAVP